MRIGYEGWALAPFQFSVHLAMQHLPDQALSLNTCNSVNDYVKSEL